MNFVKNVYEKTVVLLSNESSYMTNNKFTLEFVLFLDLFTKRRIVAEFINKDAIIYDRDFSFIKRLISKQPPSGNFATRAERLKATAEAYATRPGIDLDFSDDESFRTAAEDSLFTLTEGALKIMVATNRYLHLSGVSESPLALQETVKLLNQDLPKLRGFDFANVKFVSPVAATMQRPNDATMQRRNDATSKRPARPVMPSLPVCGILTTPFPYLVMRDGRRISEGGVVGDATILSIAADSVTVTNSAGRFTWKP